MGIILSKSVIVVGAGVGGLATAIRLQKEGYQVSIYEKEAQAGGKMHQIKKDGYTFDLGPSIVMMPELYREVFEVAGVDPDDYIPMKQIEPMYRAFYGEEKDKTFDFSSDLTRVMSQIEKDYPKDAEGFLAYLNDIYHRFNIAKDHFIQRPFLKATDFYNPSTLYQGLRLRTLNSANSMLDQYFENEELKNIISFQTLYIGISPFDGPSLYSIIPMIELLYGVWFIEGGMYTMAQSMVDVFESLGGKIYYNQTVSEIPIENGRAKGIRMGDELIEADFVVNNADFPYAMKHLVSDEKTKGKYTDQKIDQMDYSCSCFILYLGMDREYNQSNDVHNFVFSDNVEENFAQIFDGRKLTDPSFYVYIGSKADPSMAPEGKDGLYILMPVSELSTSTYEWDQTVIDEYKEKIFSSLEKVEGFENVRNEVVSESIMTPHDFEDRFNAYNGATFGLRPTLRQSNHMRPQVKQKGADNLYFAGSSIHPGAGVPIVLISAKIAAQQLIKEDRGG